MYRRKKHHFSRIQWSNALMIQDICYRYVANLSNYLGKSTRILLALSNLTENYLRVRGNYLTGIVRFRADRSKDACLPLIIVLLEI